jgi:hypothetical protein
MKQPDSESSLNRTLDIPSSGIVFASGGSLIGTAIGGPAGGMMGAIFGGLSGVAVEILSQRLHQTGKTSKK